MFNNFKTYLQSQYGDDSNTYPPAEAVLLKDAVLLENRYEVVVEDIERSKADGVRVA